MNTRYMATLLAFFLAAPGCSPESAMTAATTDSTTALSTRGETLASSTGTDGDTSVTTGTSSTGDAPTTGSGTTGGSSDWDLLVAASTPLNWWRLDELEGSMAIDHGSAGNNGIYVNGVTLGQEAPLGRRGVHLDGATNAHVLVDAPPLEGEWTVEAIFLCDATTNPESSALLSTIHFPTDIAALKAEQYQDSNRLGYTRYGETDVTFSDEVATTPVVFTHVAFVGRADGVCAHVDGMPAGCQSTPTYLSRGAIGISHRDDNDQWYANFGGMIDELVIYDRSLTNEEIAEHAAAATQ